MNASILLTLKMSDIEKYDVNLDIPTALPKKEEPFFFCVTQDVEGEKEDILEVTIGDETHYFVGVAPPKSLLSSTKVDNIVKEGGYESNETGNGLMAIWNEMSYVELAKIISKAYGGFKTLNQLAKEAFQKGLSGGECGLSLIKEYPQAGVSAIASAMRESGYVRSETRKGLMSALPQISEAAIDLGAVLLDAEVYPNTNKDRMKDILVRCNYLEAEVLQALKILYPLIFTVQSTSPWQDTGITIDETEIVLIEYISGRWNVSPWVSCGPEGKTGFNAKPGYALPNRPEGALVGRLEGKNFLVRYKTETPIGSGKLELCSNDDLNGQYGAGLTDNSGSITVKIKVRRYFQRRTRR